MMTPARRAILRFCTGCKTTKARSHFYVNTHGYIHSKCKRCDNERRRALQYNDGVEKNDGLMPYKEIAAVLAANGEKLITESRVQQLCAGALRKLRAGLEELGITEAGVLDCPVVNNLSTNSHRLSSKPAVLQERAA